MDDIVKKKWENKPSDTQKAKDQWSFSINYIGHKRVFLFGTRKYLGDPLEFLEKVIPNLVMDVKTPFVMEGKFPEWKPKLDSNGKEILLAPEIHSWVELDAKRNSSLRAWMAEEMQDPQALGNKIWDRVIYKDFVDDPVDRNYDICFVYIDRATTIKKSSDQTGLICGLRALGGKRLITHDFTSKITMEDALLLVNGFVKTVHDRNRRLTIVLVIEKQGGGDDYIMSIKTRDDFGKDHTHNWIREYCVIIEVSSTGDKLKRIENRLEAPVKNGAIEFLSSLSNSPLVQQILDFPNILLFDAIDALSTGDFELTTRYQSVGIISYAENMVLEMKKALVLEKEAKREEGQLSLEFRGLDKKGRKTVFERGD